MKEHLVVIGNGMAGARTVEEIVRRAPDKFRISMFGDEPHGNYNRILLSDVLGGAQQPEDIFLHPLDWYRSRGITLHAGVRARHINRARREVVGDGGVVETYDKLIIATGSRPLMPPVEGLLNPEGERKAGIFVMRTLDDCAAIAGYAVKSERAVVVGGGLLGLEAARGLMRYGAQVTVVHRNRILMSQQLDESSGAMLCAQMEKLGVRVLLEKITAEIEGQDHVTGVKFADGQRLDCDMVVFACGIVPNIEVGREGGFLSERGLLVDDQMRSQGEENVFVVGECAQHRGVTYGLVAPLWEQGKVLAEVISGKNPHAAYHGSKQVTKLKVMGVELASLGEVQPRPGDEEIVYREARRGIYKKLVVRDGKLAGAILLGDVIKAAALTQTFDRQSALPDDRAALLFDIGKGTGKASAMLEMPDEAPVCNCNGVSKGAIRRAAAQGPCTPEAVMSCTRAGSGCGSCKTLVREIVEWVRDSKAA
ncbi:nitrite reductase [NAD(P)H], large subunit [Abditibacterium utsteinense]|uniref:Nitrite reductase [NAD(P)H], large subunit n=1 Tax=Abditibacterium utsteinense TaxID=1960156 RepID=A0A2S8SW32_9BACT|nr:FAD-dependent oxidoreductase [Abditibacterium utsteinense]PQV65005.1 nitrite reductase [NAD(P)H], large subunit [Abditibacterium utsteinense]